MRWSRAQISRRLGRLQEQPFGRLVAHFLARLVRGGHETESTEFEFGAGPLLGLLAAPGAFSAILLFEKYSSLNDFILGRHRVDIYRASIPDKYFFITLAMAVAGIVTALKWDKILPDAQDYLNLAPLPVRPGMILRANAAAIVIAVLIFVGDVNGVSSVLFPMVLAAYAHLPFAELTQFAVAHAASVILASLFAFCAVFALLGALAAVLPREVFRSCSPWVRGAALVGSILVVVAPAVPAADPAARFLPPMWFLGLEQKLQSHATPAMDRLALDALLGCAAVVTLMVASYGFSYRRRFAGVLEGGRRPSDQRVFAAALAVLDLFARGSTGFERACHRFVVRAMLRNEAHRMCIAVAAGLGWLMAIQEASAGSDMSRYRAPLIAVYLLVLGLRIAFELPASVASNWIFRALLNPGANEPLGAARRGMMSFVVPVVLLPTFIWVWWRTGLAAAAVETLYTGALALCLIEVLLAGYRKIPLTCPMPGFRHNLLALCVVQIVGFGLFTGVGGRVEAWMFAEPWGFALLPALMFAAWQWNRARLRRARIDGELEEGLTFENARQTEVEVLNLFDAG